MKRRMGFLEGSMYAGRETAVNLVFSVSLEGFLVRKNVEDALVKIQFRHPLLKVCVQEDDQQIPWYVSPEISEPISLRIVERENNERWKAESEAEWATPFAMETGPLARLVWVRSSDYSEFLLVCHHCICDATSVINLMGELLELIDSPQKNRSAYRQLSVKQLIPENIKNSTLNIVTGKFLYGATRVYLSAVKGKKEIRKDHFYSLNWKLGKTQTEAVLKKCREEGISINTVLCLVFLEAFKKVLALKGKRRLFCSVDIRRFLPEIGPDHLFPFPVMIDLSVEKNDALEFWEQAKRLREKLYSGIDKTDAGKMLMYTEYLVPLLPKSVCYAKAAKGPHDFTFSNMGRIPLKEEYKSFRIRSVSSPASRFPMGNPTKIATSTFAEQIDFVFTSEEGFLKHKQALAIKETAMEMLLNQVYNNESVLSYE